ncbi:MAG: tetratricopeptide repeat protein [Flavobacteriales bacterium]|nr:tetratricopeptide repeat protein [Flavobacteriales bacterium]
MVAMSAAAAQGPVDKVRGLIDKGKPYKAITRCDHYLLVEGEDMTLRVLRGTAENEIARYKDALDDARLALVADPGNKDAELQAGIAFLGLYAGDSALVHLHKAPEGREKELRIGMALAMEGRCREARNHFDAILAGRPDDIQVLRERGGCFAQEGDSAKARMDLDRAISLDPRDPVSWNARGFHRYATFGEHERAIRDYDRAIKLNPNYSYAFNNRGWSRARSGDDKGAERDIRVAGKKNPKNPYVDLNLGLILLSRGDTLHACSSLHDAVEKGGTPLRADDLRTALASCPVGQPRQGPAPVVKPAGEKRDKVRNNAPGSPNAP